MKKISKIILKSQFSVLNYFGIRIFPFIQFVSQTAIKPPSLIEPLIKTSSTKPQVIKSEITSVHVLASIDLLNTMYIKMYMVMSIEARMKQFALITTCKISVTA